MSLTRILCEHCGFPLAFCACGKPQGTSATSTPKIAAPSGAFSVAGGSKAASSASSSHPPAELMHEWMQADSPQFDIDPEKITERLAQENDFMLRFIRKYGLENVLRREMEASNLAPAASNDRDHQRALGAQKESSK